MWFLFTLLIIVLLFLFPKPMSIVLCVAAIVGAIGGLFYYFQHKSMKDELAAVELTVRYAPLECPEERPLLVEVNNRSSLEVIQVDWVYSARRPGYRSEMTGEWLLPRTLRESVQPGSSFASCFTAPQPPAHASGRQADHPSHLDIGIRESTVLFGE